MAKKLIKTIANKFKKMSEEVKNTVENEENQPKGQNTTAENTATAAENTNTASQQTDNVAETDPAKAWEDKYNEMNDKYIRLYSEFDNYKRRTSRERIDLLATANADMLKAILPVLDDFDRGFKNMEKASDVLALREGVELIYNKFKNTLQSKGLQEMKSIGEPFDAEVHEAITNVPAPSDDMKGKVVDEVEKGYYLHGKVIRYAKVVVGN